MTAIVIAPDIKDFAESGVAAHVGVNHPEQGPCLAGGWGFRVYPESQRADVFVDVRSSGAVIDALERDGRIAVVIAEPVSYRSLQFKGRVIDIGEPSPLDKAWVARTRETFTASVAIIGEPPAMSRNYWTDETLRVSFAIEALYDQTPGQNAGKQLA